MFKNSENPEKITLSDEILERYVGTYRNVDGDIFTLTREPGVLKIVKDKEAPYILYPQAEDRFFLEDFDFTIEFLKNDTDTVAKMVAYYEGQKIIDAKKIR
jgi:hypothetical protein